MRGLAVLTTLVASVSVFANARSHDRNSSVVHIQTPVLSHGNPRKLEEGRESLGTRPDDILGVWRIDLSSLVSRRVPEISGKDIRRLSLPPAIVTVSRRYRGLLLETEIVGELKFYNTYKFHLSSTSGECRGSDCFRSEHGGCHHDHPDKYHKEEDCAEEYCPKRHDRNSGDRGYNSCPPRREDFSFWQVHMDSCTDYELIRDCEIYEYWLLEAFFHNGCVWSVSKEGHLLVRNHDKKHGSNKTPSAAVIIEPELPVREVLYRESYDSTGFMSFGTGMTYRYSDGLGMFSKLFRSDHGFSGLCSVIVESCGEKNSMNYMKMVSAESSEYGHRHTRTVEDLSEASNVEVMDNSQYESTLSSVLKSDRAWVGVIGNNNDDGFAVVLPGQEAEVTTFKVENPLRFLWKADSSDGSFVSIDVKAVNQIRFKLDLAHLNSTRLVSSPVMSTSLIPSIEENLVSEKYFLDFLSALSDIELTGPRSIIFQSGQKRLVNNTLVLRSSKGRILTLIPTNNVSSLTDDGELRTPAFFNHLVDDISDSLYSLFYRHSGRRHGVDHGYPGPKSCSGDECHPHHSSSTRSSSDNRRSSSDRTSYGSSSSEPSRRTTSSDDSSSSEESYRPSTDSFESVEHVECNRCKTVPRPGTYSRSEIGLGIGMTMRGILSERKHRDTSSGTTSDETFAGDRFECTTCNGRHDDRLYVDNPPHLVDFIADIPRNLISAADAFHHSCESSRGGRRSSLRERRSADVEVTNEVSQWKLLPGSIFPAETAQLTDDILAGIANLKSDDSNGVILEYSQSEAGVSTFDLFSENTSSLHLRLTRFQMFDGKVIDSFADFSTAECPVSLVLKTLLTEVSEVEIDGLRNYLSLIGKNMSGSFQAISSDIEGTWESNYGHSMRLTKLSGIIAETGSVGESRLPMRNQFLAVVEVPEEDGYVEFILSPISATSYVAKALASSLSESLLSLFEGASFTIRNDDSRDNAFELIVSIDSEPFMLFKQLNVSHANGLGGAWKLARIAPMEDADDFTEGRIPAGVLSTYMQLSIGATANLGWISLPHYARTYPVSIQHSPHSECGKSCCENHVHCGRENHDNLKHKCLEHCLREFGEERLEKCERFCKPQKCDSYKLCDHSPKCNDYCSNNRSVSAIYLGASLQMAYRSNGWMANWFKGNNDHGCKNGDCNDRDHGCKNGGCNDRDHGCKNGGCNDRDHGCRNGGCSDRKRDSGCDKKEACHRRCGSEGCKIKDDYKECHDCHTECKRIYPDCKRHRGCETCHDVCRNDDLICKMDPNTEACQNCHNECRTECNKNGSERIRTVESIFSGESILLHALMQQDVIDLSIEDVHMRFNSPAHGVHFDFVRVWDLQKSRSLIGKWLLNFVVNNNVIDAFTSGQNIATNETPVVFTIEENIVNDENAAIDYVALTHFKVTVSSVVDKTIDSELDVRDSNLSEVCNFNMSVDRDGRVAFDQVSNVENKSLLGMLTDFLTAGSRGVIEVKYNSFFITDGSSVLAAARLPLLAELTPMKTSVGKFAEDGIVPGLDDLQNVFVNLPSPTGALDSIKRRFDASKNLMSAFMNI